MPPSNTTLVEQAIEISQEWDVLVFPCRADKRPACRNGHLDATDDPAEIARLFASAPAAELVGVFMKGSGLVAIDWDAYKQDQEAAGWVEQHRGLLNTTRSHKTPSDGVHWIFEAKDDDTFPGNLFSSIDIKHNGYVIWPTSGSGYSAVGDESLNAMPEQLRWAIRDAAQHRRKAAGGTGTGADPYANGEEAVAALQSRRALRHEAIKAIALDIQRKNPLLDEDEQKGMVIDLLKSTTMDASNQSIWEWMHHDDPKRADEIFGKELDRIIDWNDRRVSYDTDEVNAAVYEKLQAKGRLLDVRGARYEGGSAVEEKQAAEEAARETRETLDRILGEEDDWLDYDDPWDLLTDVADVVHTLDYYEAGTLGVMTADSGVGKSTLAILDCISLASGLNLAGRNAEGRQMPALYLGYENSDDSLRRKVGAACLHHGITPRDLKGWLTVRYCGDPDGSSDGFQIAKRNSETKGIEVDEAAVQWLIDEITKLGAGVVFVDPFTDAFSDADENSVTEMKVALRAFRRIAFVTGACVIVVHHTPKAQADAADRHSNPFRGTGGIKATARTGELISRPDKHDAKRFDLAPFSDPICREIVKANEAATGTVTEVWFDKLLVKLPRDKETMIPVMVVPEKAATAKADAEEWLNNADHREAIRVALERVADGDKRNLIGSGSKVNWFGHVVAQEVGLDVGEGLTDAQRTDEAKANREMLNYALLHCLGEKTIVLSPDGKRVTGVVTSAAGRDE